VTTIRRVSVALCLALLVAAPVTGQATAPQVKPETLTVPSLDAFVAEQVKTKGLVGLSIGVMQDGKLTLAKGYGRSILAGAIPVDPSTRFAIGSITKQFTSACILLLAEDGKLAVTDKVAKYYPALTRANDITLLDLMNHVSGYPDYYPLDFVDRRMQKTIPVDELIRQYGTSKLDFEPGSRYSYSNTGFVILGRVVEKVSGEPYAQFLERRILKPLGLEHTAYEPRVPSAGFAQGYVTFALSPPEVPAPEGPGWVAAAGALYSTPTDLAKWDLALVTGKVLKPESFTLMTTPRKLNDGKMSNYGCGLAISTRNDLKVLGHNGAVAGFYALNTMVPSSRSAAVLLSNLDDYDTVNAIYARMIRMIVRPQAAPAQPASAKPAPSEKPYVPAIKGPPAPEACKMMLLALEAGRVDRTQLSDEFNYFLTDERIRDASARLKPFGEPTKVEVESVNERGGMEVARVRFVFAKGVLTGLMYRMPDGKIEQFFVNKE
jgi:D-alanyl-D-alanine carboxypeptidase